MMAKCRPGKTPLSEPMTDFCWCICAPPGPNELTLYSHLVLPWYQHHWKVHDMFEGLFYYAWMIIIKSLFSRKTENRRLGGLSSLVATWVVITTTCGANSDVISGCRLDDLLFAGLLLTEYLHPFYCDIYITEMYMKILYICFVMLGNFSTGVKQCTFHWLISSEVVHKQRVFNSLKIHHSIMIDDFTVLSSPVAPRFGIWQRAVPPVTMELRWGCQLDGLWSSMPD